MLSRSIQELYQIQLSALKCIQAHIVMHQRHASRARAAEVVGLEQIDRHEEAALRVQNHLRAGAVGRVFNDLFSASLSEEPEPLGL